MDISTNQITYLYRLDTGKLMSIYILYTLIIIVVVVVIYFATTT